MYVYAYLLMYNYVIFMYIHSCRINVKYYVLCTMLQYFE